MNTNSNSQLKMGVFFFQIVIIYDFNKTRPGFVGPCRIKTIENINLGGLTRGGYDFGGGRIVMGITATADEIEKEGRQKCDFYTNVRSHCYE